MSVSIFDKSVLFFHIIVGSSKQSTS